MKFFFLFFFSFTPFLTFAECNYSKLIDFASTAEAKYQGKADYKVNGHFSKGQFNEQTQDFTETEFRVQLKKEDSDIGVEFTFVGDFEKCEIISISRDIFQYYNFEDITKLNNMMINGNAPPGEVLIKFKQAKLY